MREPVARKLDDLRDAFALSNTACLQCMLKDYSAGILTFRMAIQAGFRNMHHIKLFLDNEEEGIGTLKGHTGVGGGAGLGGGIETVRCETCFSLSQGIDVS